MKIRVNHDVPLIKEAPGVYVCQAIDETGMVAKGVTFRVRRVTEHVAGGVEVNTWRPELELSEPIEVVGAPSKVKVIGGPSMVLARCLDHVFVIPRRIPNGLLEDQGGEDIKVHALLSMGLDCVPRTGVV